jgi:hypothetical protein
MNDLYSEKAVDNSIGYKKRSNVCLKIKNIGNFKNKVIVSTINTL